MNALKRSISAKKRAERKDATQSIPCPKGNANVRQQEETGQASREEEAQVGPAFGMNSAFSF
jgi:hypothetical protein